MHPAKIVLIFLLFVLYGCRTAEKKQEETLPPPNIIWFVAEDLSPRFSFYGDTLAHTPAINSIAEKGIVYENAFTVSGVCAPSRSSMITGCYPSSIGTQHMRQRSGVIDLPGVPKYNAVPPPTIKAFPELLRTAGYWTASYRKLDYQFGAPFTIWDSVSENPHWRQRSKAHSDKPFFIYNTYEITHEINIWPDSTKQRFFQEFNIDTSKLATDVVSRPPLDSLNRIISLKDVQVPPYLPDTDLTREHIVRLYYNTMRMDQQIAKVLADLESDGLADSTILFFLSDHGDCLPRGKRWLYDSGTKVPLVIYIPDQYLPKGFKQTGRDQHLYSYLDLPPTVLEMAGVHIPEWIQGQSILSDLQEKPRTYVYGARDRIDNRYDIRRAIRSDRYRLIKNFMPEMPYQQQQDFLEQMPLVKDILRRNGNGMLTPEEAAWLAPSKPEIELYDLKKDPFEIHNLAQDSAYAQQIFKMQKDLRLWMEDIDDLYQLEEKDQAEKAWPGGKQPITQKVRVEQQGNKIKLSCATIGASIAYKVKNTDRWEIYKAPFEYENKPFIAKAVRYGYKESAETIFKR